MKRTLIILSLIVIALLSVQIAAAQGPGGGNRPFGSDGRPFGGNRPFGGERDFFPIQTIIEIVAEATGLDEAEILRLAREEDMTLAEIISSNGGDVAAVEAQIIAELSAASANDIAEFVSNALNNPLPQPFENRPVGPGHSVVDAVVDAIVEATDLEPADIREQAQSGQTFSEIATAAGADPAAITAAAKTALTEQINQAVENNRLDQARADEMLSNLDAVLNEVMTTPVQDLRQERIERAHQAVALNVAVIDAAADELGMEEWELRRALEAGDSIASYVTENGGNLDSVTAAARANAEAMIAAAVEDGKMTQEEADELLATLDTAISDMLNREILLPRDGGLGEGAPL